MESDPLMRTRSVRSTGGSCVILYALSCTFSRYGAAHSHSQRSIQGGSCVILYARGRQYLHLYLRAHKCINIIHLFTIFKGHIRYILSLGGRMVLLHPPIPLGGGGTQTVAAGIRRHPSRKIIQIKV